MCCFSRRVEKVANTSIFARASKDHRQYLVYSMTLSAKEDLAMILPIPTPKNSPEDAVKFISLKEYPTFFKEMAMGFHVPTPGRGNFGAPKSAKKDAAPKLKIVEVGSFEASFVPTVKDFARLDERFRLPPGTWDELPAYKDYGFAVFKLKKGEKQIHPMAFEFPRRNKRSLFFPTVHIHDGKVHDRAGFDHVLYCQGADTGMRWTESPQPAEMFLRKLDQAKGVVDGKAHVYRKVMVGMYKNEDTWV